MQKYTPLTLELINEGRFLADTHADLADLQERLLAFHDHYGDAAKGAKAKLTIEITLACESPGDNLFSVKAAAKKAAPNRPASTTIAVSDETEDGQPRLFVRRSGSDASTPRQGKLATDDGRTIDVDTGKPAAAAD